MYLIYLVNWDGVSFSLVTDDTTGGGVEDVVRRANTVPAAVRGIQRPPTDQLSLAELSEAWQFRKDSVIMASRIGSSPDSVRFGERKASSMSGWRQHFTENIILRRVNAN